jgi:glycosyltransferase involved in cell wall biosynthesis
MTPRVDVVIPCYRYGRFLRECVFSVLIQEDVDVRVLIIDDASNDGSADIARELAEEDQRVDVILHSTNRGHIATYNEGIEWVSAKYLLLLSADDLIAPGCLKRAVSIMEERPSITMTFGHESKLFSNQQTPTLLQQDSDARWTIRPGIDFITEFCESTVNRIGTSTAVVRTEAQRSVGGYRSELPFSGDLEMWLRLATGGDVAETELIQGIRRMHGTNMTVAQFGSALADFKQLNAAFDSFFENEGRRLDNFKDLWVLSRSRLAKRFLSFGIEEIRKKISKGSISKGGLKLVAAVLFSTMLAMPAARR